MANATEPVLRVSRARPKARWRILALVMLVMLCSAPAWADEMTPLRNEMYQLLEAADFTRNTGRFRADTANKYPQWPTFRHKQGAFSLYYDHRAISSYISLHIDYPKPQGDLPSCTNAGLTQTAGHGRNDDSDPFRVERRTAAKVSLRCWLPYTENLGWMVNGFCPSTPDITLYTEDYRQVCGPLLRDLQAIVNARLGAGGELPEGEDMPFDTEVLLGIAAALGALGFGWPLIKFMLNQFSALGSDGTAALSDVAATTPAEPYDGYQDEADYLRFRKHDLEKLKNDLRSYRRNFKPKDPGYSEERIKQMQADIRLAKNDLKSNIKAMKERGGRPPDLRGITHESDVYADTSGVREEALNLYEDHDDIDRLFNNRERISDFLAEHQEFAHLRERILKPGGEVDHDLLNKVKRLHTERMGNPLPDLDAIAAETSTMAILGDSAAGMFHEMSTSATPQAMAARCVLDGITGGYSELVFTPAGEYYNMQQYLADNHADLGADGDPSFAETFNLGAGAFFRSGYNVLLGEGVSRTAGFLTEYGSNKITDLGEGIGKKISSYYDDQIGKCLDEVAESKNLSSWAKTQKANPWVQDLAEKGTTTRGLGAKTLEELREMAEAKAARASASANAMRGEIGKIKAFGQFLNDNLVHFDTFAYKEPSRYLIGDRADLVVDTDWGFLKQFNGMKAHSGDYPKLSSVLGNLAGQKAGDIEVEGINMMKALSNRWGGAGSAT